MTAVAASPISDPGEPYKGLVPYSADDASFFFGRNEDAEIVYANLMANPLTVVYGVSGVGKTSLLRAGVVARLQREAARNRSESGSPQLAVAVCGSWHGDPLGTLAAQIRSAALEANPDEPGHEPSSALDLTQALEEAQARVGGELFVILDQFEEYFLYHPDEEGLGTLAAELPRVIGRPGLPVNVIVSLREDALAKLDRFKGRIPALFEHYLRIGHLDYEAARSAIERPLSRYNELATGSDQVTIEPALVDAVLDQITTGRVVVGGLGGLEDRGGRVETPYLQLVMTRLWDEEQTAGSRTLRLATLQQLGGAEQIARTYLDAALNTLSRGEQEVAAQIFHFLVTPTGTKIAHTATDLAAYASVAEDELHSVLDRLADARIIRAFALPQDPAGVRYEVFHDVVVAPILDWRARFLLGRERARRWRRLWRRSD